jgi:hypothetical protein
MNAARSSCRCGVEDESWLGICMEYISHSVIGVSSVWNVKRATALVGVRMLGSMRWVVGDGLYSEPSV